MIKKDDGYLLTGLKHQYLVKTIPFSTAKTIDMYDYIKPTQRDFKPEIFILHVETNDLPLNKSPKEISEDIVTLAESMKTENNKIIVSSIVCRADSFREKVGKVNAHLEEICAEKDIAIITHSNINPKRHLNKSRLHLNDAGISVLVRNFKAFLTNLDWQKYEDSVSGNSPSVIGDSVSSNDIIRMKKQRLDNANNTIIGHLNINSFRNKFVFVKDVIKLFDVFLVSESKLNHTFPSNQFRINSYKSFRLDRKRFVYKWKYSPANHYKSTYIFQILKLLQLNFTKIIKSDFC